MLVKYYTQELYKGKPYRMLKQKAEIDFIKLGDTMSIANKHYQVVKLTKEAPEDGKKVIEADCAKLNYTPQFLTNTFE